MRNATRKPIGLIVLFAWLSVGASAQDVSGKIDAYLNSLTQAKTFSGTVLVAQKGNILLSKGYGFANIELDVPNSPQTKFRLGSITKQFTAASVLLLQERGKLSVQDPICKFVSDCPPAWAPVTIHHLLSHTGGIPNYTDFPDFEKTIRLPADTDALLARFRSMPLSFVPGEKWAYSNSGYILLGVIIEKASGQKYGDFVRQNIFEPLKMVNSGYDRADVLLKNRASGYSSDKGERVNAGYMDMTIPHAAGALYSTVDDMYLWDQALYTNRLLNAKSMSQMFTVVRDNYAYGWGVINQFDRPSVSHGGGINGFATYISRFPAEQVTIIVLSNFEDASAGRIARNVAGMVFGVPVEAPRQRTVATIDPKIYDSLTGKYALTPEISITITNQDRHLMLQVTGQNAFELFPESESKFFLRVVDAQVTFVRNSAGKVTELVLHQNGDHVARKVE